jgi:hypothetical protein
MIERRPHAPIYGLMAEFLTPEEVVEATRRAYERGYRRMDAYSPMPVEGLDEALGFQRSRMAAVVLIGGLIGGIGGYFMQWYSAVIHYPYNVGGRPFHSWPAFIPITFETTVLCASLAAVLGMLGLNGLPRPHHPVFNVPGFVRASHNRFFLCIQSIDPQFDPEATRRFLEEQHSQEISVVDW